jgi:MFS family permease
MGSYFGIQLVVSVAQSGAINYLVPLQLDVLDPATKVTNLGVIGTVAAVLGVVSQPLWGLLSDRTRTRFGRRVPWVLGGILGLAACIAALALASTFLAILVFAAGIQVFWSMIAAPLLALLPDRTPISRRGTFSALGGIGGYLGIAAGLLAASAFASSIPTGYLVLAAMLVVLATPIALLLRRDSRELPRPERIGFVGSAKSFWVSPRKHPDFAWAFVSRVILMAGYWGITSFILYQLQDYVGLSRKSAAAVVPVISIGLIVGVLITVFPAGALSDRLGRRKPIVLGAAVVMGLSVIVPLVSPTTVGIAISLGVAGLALGAYLAVDQAIMTLVLPDPERAGQHLGVLNVAQTGGQALAPALASLVIGIAGYPGQWVFAGIMCVIGGVAILPIKGLR